MSEELPPILNRWRDEYVQRMRALVQRFRRAHPADLDGILGRAESVVGAQLTTLDELADLDLEQATGADARRAAVETLLRAQHLPNVLVAMSRVLEEQEKDRALEPIADEARALAERLALLTQAWVLRHGDALEGDGDVDWI